MSTRRSRLPAAPAWQRAASSVHARSVASVATELGGLVDGDERGVEPGTPLVDDPDRVSTVRQLGVDETSFPAANRAHATVYVTGLADLEGDRMIDLVEGNAAADPAGGTRTPKPFGWGVSEWWRRT